MAQSVGDTSGYGYGKMGQSAPPASQQQSVAPTPAPPAQPPTPSSSMQPTPGTAPMPDPRMMMGG